MLNMIEKAINLAARYHEGQRRKGTDIPYIAHPFAVAVILAQAGCPEEVIVAGILHDTLEDTILTPSAIEEAFGSRVAQIVQGASEPDHQGAEWEERKAHTIRYLAKEAPLEVRLVAAADKLHNIRSIAADLREHGEKTWERFRRGKAAQAGYYRGLVESLCHRQDNAGYERLFKNLEEEVQRVFPHNGMSGFSPASLVRK